MRDKDQFRRRFLLLRHIPLCAHGKRSVVELHDLLQQEQLDVTKRTIQRDLAWLARDFPIRGDEQSPQGWCWANRTWMGIPMMDVPTALSMKMVATLLPTILPASLLEDLSVYQIQADERLSKLKPLGQWHKRVAVLQESLQLPINLNHVVHRAVLRSLELACRLQITYQSPHKDHPRVHLLDPWGIILRDGMLYLVGYSEKVETPLIFAVHRIHEATLVEQSARAIPEGFDLVAFGQTQLTFASPGTTIELVLQVHRSMAFILEERPLSIDQKKEKVGTIWVTFSATVTDSQQLRWWILSHADNMRVLEPKALRREIIVRLKNMLTIYGSMPELVKA